LQVGNQTGLHNQTLSQKKEIVLILNLAKFNFIIIEKNFPIEKIAPVLVYKEFSLVCFQYDLQMNLKMVMKRRRKRKSRML
jgi:hypothetical protein